MYDLISHLIYLDTFSEKKTHKTSLGKRTSLSPNFSSYFRCLRSPPLASKEGEAPAPRLPQGPGSGDGAPPTKGCQIDGLHRGSELPNVFLCNVSALNDRDPRQFTVTSIFFNEV